MTKYFTLIKYTFAIIYVGITFSIVTMVLGVFTLARAAFLFLSGMLLVSYYGDREGYRNCGDCNADWQFYKRGSERCEAANDDNSYVLLFYYYCTL